MQKTSSTLLALLVFLICGIREPFSQEQEVKVKLGIDVLIEKNIGLLKGKRVGLITNQTGVNHRLEATVDLLHKHPKIRLVALFGPEHGLRGMIEAGQNIPSSRDKHTGLPIYSLYGSKKRPTEEMLRGLDTLIFDIQDIGVRWYTYISTMALAMEEAGKRQIEFIVLDRPNPLGGLLIEGPILNPNLKSFLGLYPTTAVHGMTIGELANLYKGEKKLPVKLQVIRMEGWNRSMTWDDTGLTWVPTSPWIPTAETAMLYPGTGFLGETGLVSIGIGYTLPFQIVGAPWISSHKLATEMRKKNLPGVVFRPFFFEPFFGKFHGKKCQGVQIHIVDSHKVMPLATAMHLLQTITEHYPKKFKSLFTESRRKSLDRHMGRKISSSLWKGQRADDILKSWEKEVKKFREERKKYLLY